MEEKENFEQNNSSLEEKKLKKTKFIAIVLTIIFLIVGYWAFTNYKKSKAQEYKILGLKKFSQGNYEEAIDYFGKAIETYKNFADPYYLTGIIYYNKYINEKSGFFFSEPDRESMDKNLRYFYNYTTKAIDIKEDYPEAHIYLGVYYYEKKQYNEAITEFDKGIELAGIAVKWKEKNKTKKKWVDYAQTAKNIIEGKDTSGALIEITDETIAAITDKINSQEKLDIISYLRSSEYSEEEIKYTFKDFDFTDEEIRIIIENGETKIPRPPQPEELKELKKPKNKSWPCPF